MISVVRLICIICIASACLTACCPPQNALHNAALRYYTDEKDHINGMQYYVDEINVVNVRKYNCDSVSAYVRVRGTYVNSTEAKGKNRHDFDKASRLTIVKRGEAYRVIAETEEE